MCENIEVMKDKFGREIDYLRISVTDLCDLRCKYCMPLNGVEKLSHKDILKPEQIYEIVSAFATLGIKKIRITGGEPLVRKGIEEIIRLIKSIPGIEEICLTTNGIKLKEKAKLLRECGVDRLNISLDTLDEKKYRDLTRFGNLSDVLDGINEAKKVGFKDIKINTVLIGGFNENEINKLIDFASENNFAVRFIELMPIGESRKLSPKSFISNELIKNNSRLEFYKNDGVSSLYRIKNSGGFVGLISPLSNRFCKECNRIRLTADGKIKPCLHSSEEIDVSKCHGEELKEALKNAIESKPKEHHLELGSSKSIRGMNSIGG